MLSLSNIWSYSKCLLEKKTPYIWRILSIKRKHHMYDLVLNYSSMKGFFFFFFFLAGSFYCYLTFLRFGWFTGKW